MQNLIQKIINWTNAHNLINGSPTKLGLKLMSEYGELCDNIAKNDLDGVKEAIGDVAVVAIIINAQQANPFSIEFFNKAKPIYIADDELTGFVCNWLCKEMMYIVDGLTHLEDVLRSLECVANKFSFTLAECLQHTYDDDVKLCMMAD